MIEIKRRNNTFIFTENDEEIIGFKAIKECHLCGLGVARIYTDIFSSLKKANLLRENEKMVCCFCWIVLNDPNIITIDKTSYYAGLNVHYAAKRRRILKLIDEGDKTAIRYMENISKISKKLNLNEKI